MTYTLDPLGLMYDTTGPASLVVPVAETVPETVRPSVEPSTEAIRPEELGQTVDITV